MNNRRRPVKLTHKQSWFRIENNSGAPTVHLYDEIGSFGISASDFVKDLDSIQGDVTIHINSPGGEVFDGLAIYQSLQQRSGNVHVIVDGLAASAATIVAMGGDKVSIAKHAQMMIHESHAVGVGNAKDMRALADLLDKCSERIAGTYADKAGGTTAEWRERMGRETWYSSDEAVEAGLADEVIPGRKVRNDWNLSIFNYAGRDKAPSPFEPVKMVGGPVTSTAFVGGSDCVTSTATSANWMIGERGPESFVMPQDIAPHEIATAPIVDLTGEPDEFVLPDVAAMVRELHEVVFDPAVIFASVQLGVNDVPSPDPPKREPVAEEPLVGIDLPAVRRALKGALL